VRTSYPTVHLKLLSRSNHISLNAGTTGSNELESVLKEVVVAKRGVMYRDSSCATEENQGNPKSGESMSRPKHKSATSELFPHELACWVSALLVTFAYVSVQRNLTARDSVKYYGTYPRIAQSM
jgi:hypothetical protein